MTSSGRKSKNSTYVPTQAFRPRLTLIQVIIYIHPRPQVPSVNKTLFAGRKWLEGAALAFTFGVATHTLGLCVNGVFVSFSLLVKVDKI